jgi:hypothetical protein
MPVRTNPLTPDYRWNETAGRYIDSRGRFVAVKMVLDNLDVAIDRATENIRSMSEGLRAGQLTLAEWQLGMRDSIRIIHTTSAAAVRGGWAKMTPADWGWVGAQVKRELKYLRNFAAQVASGKQPLNGRLTARAMQYARAGRSTAIDMYRRMMIERGMTQELLVRTAEESCIDCIGDAGKGWLPIGTLPRIGSRTCRQNCKCYFEYRE